MLHWYRLVMDSDRNPLRNLPPAQRFQMMATLSVMWTIIFCTAADAWIYSGELLVAHLLVAMGTLITGYSFHKANQVKTYRDHPAEDGTTRYDDVWGA